jgi:DNA modification methylase
MPETAHASSPVESDIQVERWPIGRLVPRALNPRTHSDQQVAQVAASIREFGWTNPILVGADDDVIAGHARLMAARKLGMEEVPVILLRHLSGAQRRALVIADNQLALNAGWDEETLRLELTLLQDADYDLGLVGFDDVELSRLLEKQEAQAGLTDEDDVPELSEVHVSAPGDLWILGHHRVLCGDATSLLDVKRLMAGDAADLVFTDPPYNVDYEGYTDDKLTIKGDRMTPGQFQQFLSSTFASYRQTVKPGASMYVCHSSSWQREFQNAMESAGFEMRCQIIWAKNTFAWGFGRYKFQHEPIFYAHVANQKDSWYGDKSQSTLWEEKKPAANRIHPTAKPVELVERALVNSSKAGDIVMDLFGGSGSTLVGCERRGRKARLMELDPKYVDCIVRRWEQYTGQQATLDADGRSFEVLAAERMKGAA